MDDKTLFTPLHSAYLYAAAEVVNNDIRTRFSLREIQKQWLAGNLACQSNGVRHTGTLYLDKVFNDGFNAYLKQKVKDMTMCKHCGALSPLKDEEGYCIKWNCKEQHDKEEKIMASYLNPLPSNERNNTSITVQRQCPFCGLKLTIKDPEGYCLAFGCKQKHNAEWRAKHRAKYLADMAWKKSLDQIDENETQYY